MNLGQLIPQIVYDLIARLIPGFTLLLTAYLLWKSRIRELFSINEGNGVSFFLVALLILLSYLIALFIEGLWCFPRSYWNKSRWGRSSKRRIEKIVIESMQGAGCRILSRIPDVKELPDTSIAYDILRMKKSDIGANLVKLRAETQLCRSLILGWFLLSIAVIIGLRFGLRSNESTFAAMPILVIVFCLLYRHRFRRYLWSLYSHWLLVVYPAGELLGCKKRNPDLKDVDGDPASSNAELPKK